MNTTVDAVAKKYGIDQKAQAAKVAEMDAREKKDKATSKKYFEDRANQFAKGGAGMKNESRMKWNPG